MMVMKAQAIADGVIQTGVGIDRATATSLLTQPIDTCLPALMRAADAVRRHFHDNLIHFCAILNAKAGGCSEDCRYCTQNRRSDVIDHASKGWIDSGTIHAAADQAKEMGSHCLSLVTAWRGLKPGKVLDEVSKGFRQLAGRGDLEAHASLGLVEDRDVLKNLHRLGVRVYHHNLETAPSYFPQTCSTHTVLDRLRTLSFARDAGMRLCCGGIVGLGESASQRAEFLEALQRIDPEHVPLNALNPLADSDMHDAPGISAEEFLRIIAVFRLGLPRQDLIIAGGKESTLGEEVYRVLDAGANGIMVGDYLTSDGSSANPWKEALEERGLILAEQVKTGG